VLDYRAGSDDVHIVGNPAPKLSGLNNLRTDAARTVVRHKFGWDGKFVVLYVGRFSIEKGLETLIRSVEYLSIRDVPVRAVFVGSGPDETRLRGLAATRGVSVEFVGFLEGEELTKRYVGADVFVLPSTSEPWGLVVNEAMEAGLPVVVSDHVGARYALVHEGENGAVFPVSDSQALTRILVELASDRRRRTTMSEASRKIITDHSVESWVHRVVDAIRQISLRSPRY
jgi:glycosyltransferase involved in cell wall biosynthesis